MTGRQGVVCAMGAICARFRDALRMPVVRSPGPCCCCWLRASLPAAGATALSGGISDADRFALGRVGRLHLLDVW